VGTTPAVSRSILPSEVATLDSLRRVCRMRIGLTPGEAASPQAVTGSSHASFGGIVGGGAANLPTVATLGTYIEQSNKEPLVRLDPGKLREMFRQYALLHGGPPQDAATPTYDQISALAQLIQADTVPYVNFNLWGQFGRRMLYKLPQRAAGPLRLRVLVDLVAGLANSLHATTRHRTRNP
jgi:hypothetical protein